MLEAPSAGPVWEPEVAPPPGGQVLRHSRLPPSHPARQPPLREAGALGPPELHGVEEPTAHWPPAPPSPRPTHPGEPRVSAGSRHRPVTPHRGLGSSSGQPEVDSMRQQRNTASFRPSPGRGGLLQGRGLGVGGQAGFHPGWSTLHTATSAWPLDLGPRHSHGARPLAWRLQEDNGAHENVHITPHPTAPDPECPQDPLPAAVR